MSTKRWDDISIQCTLYTYTTGTKIKSTALLCLVTEHTALQYANPEALKVCENKNLSSGSFQKGFFLLVMSFLCTLKVK